MLVRTRLLVASAVAAGALACGFPAYAAPSGQILSDDVTLTAASNGVLHAKETVTFEGSGAERSFVRLRHQDDRHDRRFDVDDVTGAKATVDGDRTLLRLTGGGHIGPGTPL